MRSRVLALQALPDDGRARRAGHRPRAQSWPRAGPQPVRRAGRAGVRAAAEAPYPAGDELIQPDGLAADHVEHGA